MGIRHEAVLHADLNAGYYEADAELDESAFDTLSEIARQYKLEKWDGFDKENKMALNRLLKRMQK